MVPPILFGDAAYYAAALPALTTDAPLYDPASLLPHALPPPPFWDQAPSTAILTPILLLPSGKIIWGLLLAVSVVAGIAILLPRLGPLVILWGPAVVALPPVIEGMAWGNLSSLVFLMFAIAWRWPRLAGLAIGIAAASKVAPILAVGWLMGRRDWRGTVTAVAIPAVATLVVVLFTGAEVIGDFVLVRLNQQPTPNMMSSTLPFLAPSATILAATLFVASCWRQSLSMAVLAVLSAFVASPGLLTHHLLLLLVPALGIWAPTLVGRRSTP